ncbi:MAG: hypothetical protein ACJAXQ_000517 [Parvibaculaceae bacterium]|jgi:hypothetical protein|tara:strand:- start:109 stop:489 length:381 start_codon:yes stop_codon:yes gene_type:complete
MQAARSDAFPNGSKAHSYDFVVPLTDDHKLDPTAWEKHQQDCWVHRVWGDEPDQRGLLLHSPNGWEVDFQSTAPTDTSTTPGTDPFFKLADHVIAEGEYLSILEQDDEMQTFLIVSVHPYLSGGGK